MACSCELDNYEAPSSCIYGTILDSETLAPMPLPVESSNGAIISLMEQGTDATLAQSFYAKYDGSFRNSMVFDGEYCVTASGPFIPQQDYYVTVKGETMQDIVATPYSRIATEVTLEGKKASVKYTITPTDAKYRISRSYILWNLRKETDIQIGNYATVKTNISSAATGSHTINFEADPQFQQNASKISANGGKVFIRVAAECNGHVNYSEVTQLTIK